MSHVDKPKSKEETQKDASVHNQGLFPELLG